MNTQAQKMFYELRSLMNFLKSKNKEDLKLWENTTELTRSKMSEFFPNKEDKLSDVVERYFNNLVRGYESLNKLDTQTKLTHSALIFSEVLPIFVNQGIMSVIDSTKKAFVDLDISTKTIKPLIVITNEHLEEFIEYNVEHIVSNNIDAHDTALLSCFIVKQFR